MSINFSILSAQHFSIKTILQLIFLFIWLIVLQLILNDNAYLLQVKFLFVQIPFHLAGGGPKPVSLKLGCSGQTPRNIDSREGKNVRQHYRQHSIYSSYEKKNVKSRNNALSYQCLGGR